MANTNSDFDFSKFEHGRPYKWAQWLGGLDFLAPVDKTQKR